ncbi:MAG: hypothetical protein ABTR07_17575 [Candidatus Competibacter denitrificans]
MDFTTNSNLPDQLKEQHEQAMAQWQSVAPEPPSDNDQQTSTDNPVADSAVTEPSQAITEPAQDDGWQHKYQVLKGKYDAELPRALDEARYWRDRFEQAQAGLEQLRNSPAPQSQKSADVEIPPELADSLGDEGARAVAKLLQQQRQELESRFGSQIQSTAQLSQQSAANLFWSRVNQAFPTYGDMQNDQGLNAWLNQSWPGSRRSRLQEAQEAAQRLDADAFIGLLQAYQPVAIPPNDRKAPAPTPRRAAGGGEAPSQPQPMSNAEYQKQSQRIIELRQDGRYQQAADIERQLDAAKREGRVQTRPYVADYG